MTEPSSILQFMLVIGQLKVNKRTGWVNHKVDKPESIADHMYRMSILAFLLDGENLNRDRCIKMSLAHDMAESIVGDITPMDTSITKEEKHRLEEAAMMHINELLGGTAVALEILDLWREYEAASTPGMDT